MHRNYAPVTFVTPRRGRQVRFGLLAPVGPGLKRGDHQRRSDAERSLARRDAELFHRSHNPAWGCGAQWGPRHLPGLRRLDMPWMP